MGKLKEWEVKDNGTTYEWKLKGVNYDNMEEIEKEYERLDEFAMVAYLSFVVALVAVCFGLIFAAVIRTSILKINPSIDRVYLGNEVEFFFLIGMIMGIFAQVAAIAVHARIGRLIAKARP